MAENRYDCCAVLLRGGKSRRMGQDKASLPWKGGTFLQAVASQMDMFEEKYLSVSGGGIAGMSAPGGRPGEDLRGFPAEGPKSFEEGQRSPAADGLSADWILLPDRIPDCGPLGGIYTALLACRAEWALVASCDIPAVRRSLFEILLEKRSNDTDIIYPVTPDGHRHMTCALYRKTCLPIMEKQLGDRDYRLRVLADLCRARAEDISRPELAEMLFNINSASDLRTITACR